MRKFSWLVLFVTALVIQFADAGAEEAKQSWADRVTLGGDFRYRHEGIYVEHQPDRVRHRIRLRVAVKAEINEFIDANARVATSTPATSDVGDPISTNQDLSGGFVPKTIWVDRAFVSYHPMASLSANGGKFGVPFESTDLHFDPDLNVEGISVSFQPANKEAKFTPFIRAAGFWAQERSSGADQGLFGGQVGGKVALNKGSAWLAVAYYDYGNVKNNPTLFRVSGFGNSVTTVSGPPLVASYINDYNIIDVNAQFKWKLNTVEATVLADFIQNMSPDNENTAWLAGIALRGKGKPTDWDFSYSYRVLEKDAVIGAFTDSDFAGGGTNSEGHRFAAGISPLANARLGVTWFVNQRDPDGADTHYERLMADVEVKF